MHQPPLNQNYTLEDLKERVKRDMTDKHRVLVAKPFNTWMDEVKAKPIPKMLFSELWFEGEVGILFSYTNLGKSALAIMIGDSISRGVPIPGFKMEAEAQPVLYIDFENGDKQTEKRISNNYQNHYKFSDNFIRVKLNVRQLAASGQKLDKLVLSEIELLMVEHNARVVIIDNMTYICPDAEKTPVAKELMSSFKALSEDFGISVLVLSHTPKRNAANPLLLDDLKGSGTLSIFCDSAMGIAKSARDKDLRYFKQLKQRSSEEIYDADNVIVCRLDKPDNILKMTFLEYGSEHQHLKKRSGEETPEVDAMIIKLHKEGLSYRQIGAKLDISYSRAGRVIKSVANDSTAAA